MPNNRCCVFPFRSRVSWLVQWHLSIIRCLSLRLDHGLARGISTVDIPTFKIDFDLVFMAGIEEESNEIIFQE
jgi:hypothetical protein